MPKGKKSFLASFQIADRESCETAIRNGGIAALFSAGITTVFAVIGFFVQTSDADLGVLLDPWLLVDVAVILLLAVFVFRKSRLASTLLLIYFVSGKIYLWAEIGAPRGIFLAIIFFLYYFTAMRGTFLWHSRFRDAPAAPFVVQLAAPPAAPPAAPTQAWHGLPESDVFVDLDEEANELLLDVWSWLVGKNARVLRVTMFGDVFATTPNGHIHRLDTVRGTYKNVAENQDEWFRKAADHQSEWFRVELLGELHSMGLRLAKGQVYSWLEAPMVGGPETVENIYAIPVEIHQRNMSEVAERKLFSGR